MSDQPPIPPTPPTSGPTPPGDGASAARIRPTSVDLRQEAVHADDPAALMDPAAKSLAEALRITYRLLQLAMVVLLALFLFSGFESVNQGETAIRLTFGRITDRHMGPGLKWSLPHPFGELIKVQTTAPLVTLDTAFWPALSDAEKKMSVEELANGGRDSLDPVAEGSVITGDGAIAHVKCQVKYRREDPAKARETIDQDVETSIVSGAVERGVVRAAASLTMEQLLANQGIESRAQAIAQQTLDDIGSGLMIEQFSIISSMPPRRVAQKYYEPQSALSQAKTAIEEAQADRANKLSSAAGPAAELILRQIDRYDEQLRLDGRAAADQTQETIFKLLRGEDAVIDGEPVRPLVDGEVPQLLRQAKLDATTTINDAVRDALRLRTVRASYAANPLVVLNTEWTDAFNRFLTRPSVQVQLLPPGLNRLVLLINRDPRLSKDQFEQWLRDQNMKRAKQVR